MDDTVSKALSDLDRSGSEELSILRLAKPLTASANTHTRDSDASGTFDDNSSPASLKEDLNHYRGLFSKLRFSYVEQVTKEKFLRAIVGEPPQIVEHHENIELERQLAVQKAALKAQKLSVAELGEELEAQSRLLGERHEGVEAQTSQLRQLPAENESLRELIATLRAQHPENAENPDLGLSLEPTRELVAARQTELEMLNKRLKALQQSLPRQNREVELLESELRPLEVQRAGTMAAAVEARHRHEMAERGRGDDLELKGRWYRSVDSTLTNIFQVDHS